MGEKNEIIEVRMFLYLISPSRVIKKKKIE